MNSEITSPRTGRKLIWLGWALLVLGLAGYVVQLLVLKRFLTPWYAPALGTVGLLAMVVAIRQRFSVWRVLSLVACGLLVAGQWSFLLWLSRAPEYAGPEPGQKVPTFAATRADGASFTDRDLQGSPTILLFFRGRW